jgi:hypothetical protein
LTNSFRKVATSLLLAAYVSAGVFSHGFHNHGLSNRHAPACDHEDCCAEHGPDTDQASKFSRHEGDCIGVSGQSSFQGCAVCLYLAQKPAPAAVTNEVTSAELEEEIARVVAIHRAEPPLGLHFSRAPPALA